MCKAGFTGDVAPHDFHVPVGMCKAGFAGNDAHHEISDAVASVTGMCGPGFAGEDAHHALSVPVATGMCTAGSPWDDLTEYFSGHCEFFVMRQYKWQLQARGLAKLLQHSSGAEFFQF